MYVKAHGTATAGPARHWSAIKMDRFAAFTRCNWLDFNHLLVATPILTARAVVLLHP